MLTVPSEPSDFHVVMDITVITAARLSQTSRLSCTVRQDITVNMASQSRTVHSKRQGDAIVDITDITVIKAIVDIKDRTVVMP
jgi:hypothetical protein